MYILRAFALLLFLAEVVLAQQPTPILPDPKLTPGDTFEVTAQDVCVPGYAKKVRAVPAWLKRQAYAEYGITQYKPGDYEVDQLIIPNVSLRCWRYCASCRIPNSRNKLNTGILKIRFANLATRLHAFQCRQMVTRQKTRDISCREHVIFR